MNRSPCAAYDGDLKAGGGEGGGAEHGVDGGLVPMQAGRSTPGPGGLGDVAWASVESGYSRRVDHDERVIEFSSEAGLAVGAGVAFLLIILPTVVWLAWVMLSRRR